MADDNVKMVADAERAIGEFGIKVLCMKSGHPKGWREDVKNFTTIRKAVGFGVALGMDPNTGWTVAETLQALRALQDQRVDYLEQPVKRSDLSGMAAIKRAATGVPLMADEACGSIHDAHALVAADAADVFCIKLYKHGGITPARKIAAIAEAANLKINCGGLAVLSQLEAAAGAHFYASRPTEHVMPAGEFVFGLGVIGPDPIVPDTDFVVEDGHVRPPGGPGFGITVDERASMLTLVKRSCRRPFDGCRAKARCRGYDRTGQLGLRLELSRVPPTWSGISRCACSIARLRTVRGCSTLGRDRRRWRWHSATAACRPCCAAREGQSCGRRSRDGTAIHGF
jgi:L-alanine-DL-glutamate epimerase-like enolase superfamily enzyme